jgi:parvulin-like peptidyl-prolyl isomerase
MEIQMKILRPFPVVVLALALALPGCRKDAESPRPEAGTTADVKRPEAVEPARVAVQHILVAFKGSIPEDKRTREEAQKLALELFGRAGAGEDFDALVKQFTDDEYPGIYRMANAGVDPDAAVREYSRTRMVKSFGDVSFGLEVGGIGLAVYDPAASKYGWHIIKRLE